MTAPTWNWDIARFELAYFNPRHNRWQLFSEDRGRRKVPSLNLDQPRTPSESREARHRQQIKSLLHSIREVFEESVPSADLPFAFPRPNNRNVVFRPNMPHGGELISKFKLEMGKQAPQIWRQILAYLLACVRSPLYGLRGGTIRELKGFLNSKTVQQLMDDSNNGGKMPLSQHSALDLLSILPILQHWDLWGLFLPPWCCLQVPTEAKPSRDLLEFRAPSMWESFYAAHLVYFQSPSRRTSPSIELLGYNVEVELASGDSKGKIGPGLQRRDFFSYCHRPCSRNSDHLNEYALYLGYAFFLDAIFTQLAAKSKNESNGDSSNVYLLVYPITALGWRHYLQIHVSPGGHAQRPDVRDLWEQWSELDRVLHWSRLKPFITHQLELAGFASFQFEVLEKLKNPQLRATRSATGSHDLLCECGYRLFPSTGLGIVGKQNWEYYPYEWPKGEKGPRIRMGDEWLPVVQSGDKVRPKRKRSHSAVQTVVFTSDGVSITATFPDFVTGEDANARSQPKRRAKPKSSLSRFARDCVKQLLWEQHELCKTLVGHHARLADLEEEVRLRARAEFEGLLWKADPPLLQDLHEQVQTKDLSEIDFSILPEAGRKTGQDLLQFLQDPKKTEEQNKCDIRTWLEFHTTVSVPLCLSEYYSVGPVNVMTHPADTLFKGTIAEMAKEYHRRYKWLKKRFMGEIQYFRALRLRDHVNVESLLMADLTKLENFHRQVRIHLSSLRDQGLRGNSPIPQNGLMPLDGSLNTTRSRYRFDFKQWIRELKTLTDMFDGESSDINSTFLYSDVRDAFGTLFAKLWNSCINFSRTKLKAHSFALPVLEYTRNECWRKNPPLLYRNCLAVHYEPIYPLTAENILGEHPKYPKEWTAFATASFSRFGRFFVFLPGSVGKRPILDLSRGGDRAYSVRREYLFPFEMTKGKIDAIRGRFQDLRSEEILLLFSFESWRQDK